jgi:hypothetical protein
MKEGNFLKCTREFHRIRKNTFKNPQTIKERNKN